MRTNRKLETIFRITHVSRGLYFSANRTCLFRCTQAASPLPDRLALPAILKLAWISLFYIKGL